MNRRQLVLGVVVVVAVLGVLLAGFALGRLGDDASTDASRTITATGTGIVKAEPDVADVSLGVSATARTARAARIAADALMTRVLATLKRRGVAPADLQTAQVSLSPSYGPTGSRVVGYTATNTVTARIRKLDTAGAIVAAAAGAGANNISGPSLTVSDQNAIYQKALKAAVADARAHADAIAAASDETVGDLQTAVEGSESTPMPIEAAAAKSVALATPIEPGRVEVRASVTATFAVE